MDDLRVNSQSSLSDVDDLSRLLDRPRLNIERKRSFDERSFSEMGILDSGVNSPGGRSGWETPGSSTRNSFEPHPMVAEAWDALRRSLVHFRGQPVGTIAAYDHASEEVLNYDQVSFIDVSHSYVWSSVLKWFMMTSGLDQSRFWFVISECFIYLFCITEMYFL